MTTAELLVALVRLYKKKFVLFIGIAALPQIFGALIPILTLLPLKFLANGEQLVNWIQRWTIILSLSYIAIYLIGQAAAIYAASEVYLQRETGVVRSYRFVFSRLWQLRGLTLLLAV